MVEERLQLELRRKLLHSLFGLILVIDLFYFGRENLIITLSVLLLIGSIMIIWKKRGNRIPVADWFEKTFERENVRFPGYGAFWYVLGILILSLSLSNANEIVASILILALGDSASTIFGLRGAHPLPYNQRKTIEGSISFLIFSLPSCLFIGWIGLPLAFLAAAVESLPIPCDDNLLIPVASILFFIILH
jgi:dolichol kinase